MKIYVCSICFQATEQARAAHLLHSTVKKIIRINLPRWDNHGHVCHSCIDRFLSAQAELDGYLPQNSIEDLRILPTPLRLGASPQFTGRGITIAFLDSGFYWHPDLTRPHIRIMRYVNIFSSRTNVKELWQPDVSSWHGMMTSVVAAGNGYLSGGIYRSMASEANLILIKVGSAQRICHDDITWGLRWVIHNKQKYGIRIVNISCGGDYPISYLHDSLSQTTEEAVRTGLVVVVAAGNQAHSTMIPPATAPSAITVGGLDDKNSLDPDTDEMYHSSYGPTLDGLQKPEVLAPSIWVAAPILPGTPTAAQAVLLAALETAADHNLRQIILDHKGIDADLDTAAALEPYLIRHLVEIKIRTNNVISSHYKHVDGTSFAAPIVSSVVAQMLEANPRLTPQEVKQILIKTAKRIAKVAVEHQGWGVINPRRAVVSALERGLGIERDNTLQEAG